MTKRPDVPCTGGCGRLLWTGTGSNPPESRVCQECRRKAREAGAPYRYGPREERFSEAALSDARALRDSQLAVMLRSAVERRDELASTGQLWLADRMNDVAAALAQVRDERIRLAADVGDAAFTVTPLEPGDTSS